MNKVCVIGSINMDYITESKVFPKPGETVIGSSFSTQFGGKGANQAIAAAKLGAEVYFIGSCGNDYIKEAHFENLHNYGINTEGIMIGNDHSGVAQITLVNGENSIIVAPGANMNLTIEWVVNKLEIIKKCDVVVVQLEIPSEVVEYVIKVANELNKVVILNPAPVQEISIESLEKVDFITPNEIEINQLFSMKFEDAISKYSNKIIMTKGSEGVFYHNGNNIVHIEGLKVDSVDTTGAGDTFNGALAYTLSNKWSLEEAVRFSNMAASKSVTKIGAQAAMPTMEDMK